MENNAGARSGGCKKIGILFKNKNLRDYYEKVAYAVELSKAGYRTGYFGKYLNQYNGKGKPPGANYFY